MHANDLIVQYSYTTEVLNGIMRLEQGMDSSSVYLGMTKGEREHLTKTVEMLMSYQSLLTRRYHSMTGVRMEDFKDDK